MARPRPPVTCPRCNAPVLWWRNANRDGQICVDISSDASGSVQKIVTDDPDRPGRKVVWGKKLSQRELAAALASNPHELFFTPHASTCSATREPNRKPEGLQIDWAASQRKGA